VPIVAKLPALYSLRLMWNVFQNTCDKNHNNSSTTFLDGDNTCFIYEVRPKACREFPHTDRKKFQQISDLTLQNVAICPAAFKIVEEMKKKMPM
jgi:Fe-S-cluster containining protein